MTTTIDGWVETRVSSGRTLLAISGRHIDFAPPGHPGWRAFLDRIARDHPASGSYPPDGTAFRLMAESGLTGPRLGEALARFLSSRGGAAELVAEGACLADPSLEREEIRQEVNGTGAGEYQRLRVVRLG